MLRSAFLAAGLGLAAASAAATPVGASGSWSFDFYDLASGQSVAFGELAYGSRASGLLGFADLSYFRITVHGVAYGLGDMADLPDYAWLGWDSDAGNFVRNEALCGSAGCLGTLISARSSDGTRGFAIDDAAMTVREFSTGRTSHYDFFGLGQAMPLPEPASWAMLIAGFGLTGAVMRRRAGRLPIRRH